MNKGSNFSIISLLIARILSRYCSTIFWAVAETPLLPFTCLVYSSSESQPLVVFVTFPIVDEDSVPAVEVA